MSKNKPPCIRNLKAFKNGCPEIGWDGKNGCSAWIEVPYVSDNPDDPPVIIKSCIDIVTFDINLKMLKLLAGNQQATESLRNGLCEDVGGKTEPKPDKAVTHLLYLLTQSHNKRLE